MNGNELQETELRDAFTGAMSNVANSVTVVTTDGKGGRSGATVSSFCSVSADPPTLLVCLNTQGDTSDAIRANQRFCVNVLPEDAIEIARRFAGLIEDDITDPFETVSLQETQTGLPVLKDMTSFTCTVTSAMLATSHYVFIGKVETIQPGHSKPLIYLNRKFCKTDIL